jgi:lipopolysaccharide transport system ATP-binding protein
VSRVRLEFSKVTKSFRLRSRSDSLRDALPRLVRRLCGGVRTEERRHVALREVSFRVLEGEVIGLIGVNGAGKSTSLRLAAGVLAPESGAIRVDGRVSPMIELFAGFHPDLSGRENIYLGGALLGVRSRDMTPLIGPILEFAGIGEFIDAPVRTYSSGMQVRLGFALASSIPAELLLVDEVLAVGDIEFQARCLERMRCKRESGVAVLFVSHNMEVVEQFCDRVVLLDGGVVVADGAPASAVDEYRRRLQTRGAESQSSPLGTGRRGTGEVLIGGVSFRGPSPGAPPTSCEPMRMTIQFVAKGRQSGLVFGFAVHGRDGSILCEHRSHTRGDSREAFEGDGETVVEVPSLALLPGAYSVTVYVRDSSGLLDIDYQPRAYRLVVEGERQPSTSGSVDLRPVWTIRSS